MSAHKHQSVMLDESIAALAIRSDGIYLDGSFGGGGHSKAILSQLDTRGRLYAIDRDRKAIERAVLDDERLTLEQCCWSELPAFIVRHELNNKVDGVLLDLGLSSPQLDEADRGFSFMRDGPLDMRMDQHSGSPASVWINSASQDELKKVFKEYGEERYAAKIAAAIVKERAAQPIESTMRLAELIEQNKPSAHGPQRRHPATQVFQAIRIHINNELKELVAALTPLPELLRRAGRIAVISFHSLEDRVVKRFLRHNATAGADDAPNAPLTHSQLQAPKLRIVAGLQRPGEDEINHNPRARSARLRVAERI